MYFRFFERALCLLGNKSIEEYILDNDISLLYEKYDEKDYILLKGIEARILMLPSINFKKEKIYTSALKKAKKDFCTAFFANPRKYFDSLLLKDSNFKNLLSFFARRKVDKTMKSLEGEAKRLLIEGTKNDDDRHFLMKYLKDNVDLDDDNQRKLILDIIESGTLPKDVEECNFFYCYVKKWMLRESGYEAAEKFLFTAYFPESREDAGYANGDFICMRMMDEKNAIASAVRNVCHETRHTIQSYMHERLSASSDNHVDSKVGLDYLEYCVFDDNYYSNNYWFSKIELDAEKVGLDYTMKFLSSLGKEDLSRDLFSNDRYLEKEPYEFIATPICKKEGLDYLEDFSEFSRVSMWDSIVKNNSYLVDQYPILSKLYDDGNKLSFNQMMKNDFSEGENLEIYYDYIFSYIQEGSLDNSNLSSDVYFNNLKLIYEKVIDRITRMLDSNPFVLGNVSASSRHGINISNDKIREIFTSEIVYYFSFVTKITKYLNQHISFLNNSYKGDFAKDVDFLLGKMHSLLNEYLSEFISGNSSEFLNNNYLDLLSIHNELRKDEVSDLYLKKLEKLVTDNYRDIIVDGTDYKLSDYVSQVLPMHASYLDISKLNIDGKDKAFDNYILEIISQNIKIDVDFSEIFILLDMIRDVYSEKDFWDGLCSRMNELINYYNKKDEDFANVLSVCFSNAREEHFENEMSKTPLGIEFQQFSPDVMEVISRARR